MKTVHKYRLESGNQVNALKLRQGYRLIHSEYLVTEKAVFVWIEVPLDLTLPEQEVKLKVFRTGEPVPRSFQHLTTAVNGFDPEAYHIYSIPAQEMSLERVA